MAVGFPTKVSYANGDVFSASDINDTNGTINLLQTSTLSRAAGKNVVINGGMDCWQRNTSVAGGSGATTFTADRWNAYRAAAGSTFSRQVTGDTTNLPNIQYCLRVARDSGNTGTGTILTSQSVETINAIPFAGQTVTVSFYARKGANYSATSNLLNYEFITGTGTDQNPLVSYTGSVINTGTKTLTTTWQRFTYTQTVPTNATEFALDFYFTPTGVAGAADYFEITGVQLEAGSYATTFSRAGSTIGGELALCQRYFQVLGSGTLGVLCTAYPYSTAGLSGVRPLAVEMRTIPTLSVVTGTNYYAFSIASSTYFNTFTIDVTSTNKVVGFYISGLSGYTVGQCGQFNTANAAAFVGVSAEL